MKKPTKFLFHILIFVLAQFAWFSLVGIWIYWYITNYLLLSEVGDTAAPHLLSGNINILALVSGLVLLVMLSVGMLLIFLYLNRQLNITRMYDNFIANVTHELKSPLSSVQLYLETLMKRRIDPGHQNQFYTLMLKDIERLNRLISSILYLSSLGHKKVAGKLAHDYHIYNADSVLRKVLKEVFREHNLPDESFSIDGAANCRCVIDQYWLKIVFNNLTDNAVKYSSEKPRINIRLGVGSKYFFITFTDKGIGIMSKDQKIIFNKFQRIYNPLSPNVKGTGLGLYWVRQIIHHHGGKITVHSEGKNMGTTFRIALPIYKVYKRQYINRLLRLSQKNRPSEDNGGENEG